MHAVCGWFGFPERNRRKVTGRRTRRWWSLWRSRQRIVFLFFSVSRLFIAETITSDQKTSLIWRKRSAIFDHLSQRRAFMWELRFQVISWALVYFRLYFIHCYHETFTFRIQSKQRWSFFFFFFLSISISQLKNLAWANLRHYLYRGMNSSGVHIVWCLWLSSGKNKLTKKNNNNTLHGSTPYMLLSWHWSVNVKRSIALVSGISKPRIKLN